VKTMNAKPAIYVSPELEQLRQLVAGARAQLADLETDYTKEKSRVDVVQAVLFRLLREHYQKCDRLRLTVDCRFRQTTPCAKPSSPSITSRKSASSRARHERRGGKTGRVRRNACGSITRDTRAMTMPISLISSPKSFAAVYRPHMPTKYHTPQTTAVQPDFNFYFRRTTPTPDGSFTVPTMANKMANKPSGNRRFQ